MKKIKKTNCNNQGIKRFLSPQPSNIPCKKQCKQTDIVNECPTRKDKDICLFSHNSKKQYDEIEKAKNKLQFAAGTPQELHVKNNTPTKMDWNSFVRDPGEMQESRYPVTLNTFKTMTHSLSVVNCILEDIKNATSLDFSNDDLIKERVLKNFYIQFYENTQIRNIYKLEIKACPTFVKKKIMHLPTLESNEVKVNTTNAEEVATANITHVEAISKSTELSVSAQPTLKAADQLEPLSKSVELERVEAKSTKAQENEIPSQQAKAKSRDHTNILYLPKNISYMNEAFLRRHISRYIQQVEKQEIILERIKAELLQRKNCAQASEVKPKEISAHKIDTLDEVLIDSKSPEVPTAIVTKPQRIEQIKKLFFTEYPKSNTLAYALRFHNGLKRRIILAILEMSIDEFKKYTKIHNAAEIYDEPKILSDCYNYAIKSPKIWPVNLYIQLSDLFEYLKSKGVSLSVDNLEDISPILLHWTELAVVTNFDEIMQWDFYRCKGEKFDKFTQLDVYRETFYEKCWLHNNWLHEVPKLHIEVQQTTDIQQGVVDNNVVNEDSNLASETGAQNVIKLEAVHEAPTIQMPPATTEHSAAANVELTDFMNIDRAEQTEEVNDKGVQPSVANVEHTQNTSAGHLTKSNEALVSQNIAEINSMVQTEAVNEAPNTLPAASVNLQTTTAEVETISNSNENILSSNREADAKQRIQAAKKLYFYEVEKSCTLPYLLRLNNGLKRHILHAILQMSFTEFKKYTHIHDAAEIYKNNELLQHCYDFVVKKPQVWPVNLYMRLVDLYKYVKSKGITLTAADLKHVSPKLLHWQELVTTTNYDYILFWDYYRCSGRKLRRNTNLLNAYRRSFYEKCWFHDIWVWHTPKIGANIHGDEVAAVEDKENANFEWSVITHAMVEEGVEESDTSIEGDSLIEAVATAAESGTTNVPPIVAANIMDSLPQTTNKTPSVSTADVEIQTSQHLLATCVNLLPVMREPVVVAQNCILPCKAIKQEKLSPLDKLQFNLINDEETYECVPIPEDIVDLEDSTESQEELLLPLSNSENLLAHDANLLLSFESSKDKGAQQTVQMSENMEKESIIAQESGLELKDEETQLLSEYAVEVEVDTHSAEEQQQPLIDQVSERNVTFTEQPQIEATTKGRLAAQVETCTTQEQQKQVNAGVQNILTSEETHFPAYISREVKQELLQQVQEPAGNGNVQQKQTQQATQQAKNSHIEVATAITRIFEALSLAKQKKQQQQPTFEECTAVEKQQPSRKQQKAAIEATLQQQQQAPLSAPQQQQQMAVEKRATQKQRAPMKQQTIQKQQQQNTTATTTVPQSTQNEQQLLVAQSKATTANVQRSTPQRQQPPPIVVIPIPALQQQQKIAVEKQAARKQRRSTDQRTMQVPPQQQQLAKSQKAQRNSQISEKPNAQTKLEARQLATAQQKPIQPRQPESTQTYVQQQLQQQVEVTTGPTKDQEGQQSVPQIVAKTTTQSASAQQLTQPVLPYHLLQQQQQPATDNRNENQLREAPQQFAQQQLVQQKTIFENSNASLQSELKFMSQQQLHSTQSCAQQQQPFNQSQFILQHTSTQIQEDIMIRSTGMRSQDSTNNLPTLMKVSKKQTTTTTKTKTVKPAKAATRKPAKNSDYVPQLTHVFQPLPVALSTKKAPTPPPAKNDLPPTAVIAASNLQAATAAREVPSVAAGNITATPPQANTMILTLPAATSAPNSSFVYSLSGDSTFFNSSELLKALENYQVELSQQQQQPQTQPNAEQQQSTQLLAQPQVVQLQQQQLELYNQLEVAQQQEQQQYEAATEMPQPWAVLKSASEQQQQQLQQQTYQLLLQQQQQQQPQTQPNAEQQQSTQLVYVQPQLVQLQQQQYDQMQRQQQLEFYNQLEVAQQQEQQQYEAATEMPQPWAVLECASEQQQQQQLQQQTYKLLLQQQQQQQEPQPIVFQFVDVNQASTNTNDMLPVNVWLEHNYAMRCALTPRALTPLPSPKGACRMRARPHAKPFFYRRLEKIDYFGALTALNIADYQLQCSSLGKPYLQAKIRTAHRRTVVSGDILAALLPRYAPVLVQHLQLVLQYLGEFHYNTWEQREQRKLISKCAHRTLHTLCAHILLLFFEHSTPFQTKCLDLAAEVRSCAQRERPSAAAAACASNLRTGDMCEDLSLAIEPCILAEMAELKRNL